jgi:hypothetical protein
MTAESIKSLPMGEPRSMGRVWTISLSRSRITELGVTCTMKLPPACFKKKQ